MKIIGRQPATLYITPSKPNPWYGSAREGERFTFEQLREMAKRGIDPATTAALTVRRQATSLEMWWPTSGPPPVFQFDCPVVGKRAAGRLGPAKVKVLAPNGDAKLVFPDGWVTRPHRLNRAEAA